LLFEQLLSKIKLTAAGCDGLTSGVAESSTSFGWGKGGNVTSAGWQVTLCDPIWHASSRSGVATLRTAIHLLLAYLLNHLGYYVADLMSLLISLHIYLVVLSLLAKFLVTGLMHR